MSNQTGPLTQSGKIASSMNALKHSGSSTTLFMKDDDPKEFFALLDNAFEQHRPAFDQDAGLVYDSVRARWIFTRRQRIADAHETSILDRKSDGRTWLAGDLNDVNLFDRYLTQARRALSAALKDLQTIKKTARDDERWQLQLEAQKQRLALDVERFELAKQREARLAANNKRKATPAEIIVEMAATNHDVQVDERGPHIPQAIYIGVEDGVTQVFDTVPSNADVRRIIATASQFPAPPVEVVRTYIFAGLIPAEYDWLITQKWERQIENLELRKPLSFEEWTALTITE